MTHVIRTGQVQELEHREMPVFEYILILFFKISLFFKKFLLDFLVGELLFIFFSLVKLVLCNITVSKPSGIYFLLKKNCEKIVIENVLIQKPFAKLENVNTSLKSLVLRAAYGQFIVWA